MLMTPRTMLWAALLSHETMVSRVHALVEDMK